MVKDINFKTDKILSAIEMFRELGKEMQVNQISCFLYIARYEGLTVNDLSKKTGFSHSQTSRIVTALSVNPYQDKPGLALVEKAEAYKDMRNRVITLTPKGRDLVNRIHRILS